MPDAFVDDSDLSLGVLMDHWPETIPVFIRHRMICVGCPANPFHTIRDACAEYGLVERAFICELAAATRTLAVE